MCWSNLEGDIQVEERPRRHPNGPKRKRLFFVNDRRASRGSDEFALTGPRARRISHQEMMERQHHQQQQQILMQRQQQFDHQAQLLAHQQRLQEQQRRIQHHHHQQQQHQQHQQRLHGVQQPQIWNAHPGQQEQIPVPPQHFQDPRLMGWAGHDQARLQHHGGHAPHEDDIVAVEEWHHDGQHPQIVEGAPRARMPAHLAPQRDVSRRGHRRDRSLFSDSSGSRSTGSRRHAGRRTPGFVEEMDSFEDLRQLGERRRGDRRGR